MPPTLDHTLINAIPLFTPESRAPNDVESAVEESPHLVWSANSKSPSPVEARSENGGQDKCYCDSYHFLPNVRCALTGAIERKME